MAGASLKEAKLANQLDNSKASGDSEAEYEHRLSWYWLKLRY